MNPHKFAVGDTVHHKPPDAEDGAFKVVRLLPTEEFAHHYRIKSEKDGHERVVKQSEIR